MAPKTDAAVFSADTAFLLDMVAHATSLGGWISLHTAMPNPLAPTASEIVAAPGVYGRQETTWGAPAMNAGNGQSQGSEVSFTVPASTVVTHFGVWTAETGATGFLYGEIISPPITISADGPGTVLIIPVYQEIGT